jgi:hypothetical protein
MNKIYHFIFGLSEDFNKKPFEYFHYLSIKSCYLTQENPKIYMHYLYEPKDNQWWEKGKQFVELIKYHDFGILAESSTHESKLLGYWNLPAKLILKLLDVPESLSVEEI